MSIRVRNSIRVIFVVIMLLISHRSFGKLLRTKLLIGRPAALQSIGLRTVALRSTTTDEEIVEHSETGQQMPEKFNSQFLQALLDRGFIHQCTDYNTLDSTLNKETVSAYLGFDATAKSLHVGSLLQIMILRKLQQCGHKPIILVGGGTTKVGDPSGKDESRQLLTEEVINSNIDSLASVFQKFIKFGDGPTDAIMVNNNDWLEKINYLSFLRDYGRYFTINRMLSFESVKQRLARAQPLSFLEFNYMLLQSYDFLELNRRYKTKLQLGGSDQWGNMVSGVELTRKVDKSQVFALTAPLITTSDGKKMGKSVNGAIWLNSDLLPPFDYWQFWRNTADADVIRFVKLFTEVPLETIAEYEKLEGSALNDVKNILADEATSMLHGADCLSQIRATAAALYGGGAADDLDSLTKFPLASSSLEGVTVVDLLVLSTFAASKGEARRLIKGGGAKINDEKVADEAQLVNQGDFNSSGQLKLSAGKKKHCVITLP